MPLPARLALLATLALGAGCLYRMPVQQGNLLDNSQIAELKTGMTRTQVMYLLGTPMLPEAFNNDRWDYYHYHDTGRGHGRSLRASRRITVWFKDGVVERFEDDAKAATPAPASAPAGDTTPAAPPATAG